MDSEHSRHDAKGSAKRTSRLANKKRTKAARLLSELHLPLLQLVLLIAFLIEALKFILGLFKDLF